MRTNKYTYVPSRSLSVSSMCAVAAKNSKKSGAICKSSSSMITREGVTDEEEEEEEEVEEEERELGYRVGSSSIARPNCTVSVFKLKLKLKVLSSAHLKWLLRE